MGMTGVDTMELATFDNDTGESVVSFDSWGWFTQLTIGSERVFEYGNPCGTCGIVFRKVGSVADRVSDAQAVQLLGELDALPPLDALRRLARVLQPGEYCPSIVAGTVKLIAPGAADDYFATDVFRLFRVIVRDDTADDTAAADPGTPYYRFGVDHALDRTGRLSGHHKALVTAVVMPLQDPARLDRERIAYWKRQHDAGMALTAFAVAVLDNQAPAKELPDPTYPYEEMLLLTLCLLDGHHRLQAAAELGASVRILSLLTMEYSLGGSEDIATVLSGYAP
jgi:hypothetical protein